MTEQSSASGDAPPLVRALGAWDCTLLTIGNVVGCAIFLASVVSTLFERPLESLWGLGLVALGLPVYAWWSRRSASERLALP